MSADTPSAYLKRYLTMSAAKEFKISRAAVRRLAHDAQQKFSKDSYEGALEELERFLSNVMRVSQRAAIFSRRKAVAREHVLYALDSLNIPVPEEIKALNSEGLCKLQRCNPKAPAQQRKRCALHVEVSEAAFGRLTKSIAKANGIANRVSSQARRVLQLVAEQHIMGYFSDKKSTSNDVVSRDVLTSEALQAACDCHTDVAAALTSFLNGVLDRIPPLLAISQTKTIDARLLHAVVTSMCANQGPAAETASSDAEKANPRLLRLCDRILRGRAADKRITNSASSYLAGAILALRQNAHPGAVTGRYEMSAADAQAAPQAVSS